MLHADALYDDQCIITPEGFGFSTTAGRLLSEQDDNGFYRAKASDTVIDVMEALSSKPSRSDVALVYDNNDQFVGIFTEKDYVNFSTNRAEASSEEESASFLVSPISKFVTPSSEVVGVSTLDTANKIIALMKLASVRHLVVADRLDVSGNNNNKLLTDSRIAGVVSMQDVMSVVQKDERLSLATLAKKFPYLNPIDQLTEEFKSNANQLAKEKSKQDVIRTGTAVLSISAIAAFFSRAPFLTEHADWVMVSIFVLGYVGIIFEEVFEFDKAAVALLMSTGMWVTYADYFGPSTGTASSEVLKQLGDQLSEVSEICFFLLAASTIVEVVDAHQGFKVVTNRITTKSKKTLFWTIGFLTFFLSAILNNLTVTIVMVSLLRKLVPIDQDRRLFGAMVVVAANAGGVWTPIGDVTTTMLWINNQLSTVPTIVDLFLPSLVCLTLSLAFLVGQVEEDTSLLESEIPEPSTLATRGVVVFWSGIASLLAVPFFTDLTGLPPYLAMLTGLGAIWTLTDILHMGEEERDGLRVPAALSRLDTSGILFFLGILMSIGVLDKSGLLKSLAEFLSANLPSLDIIATVIGIASALIDNVPLVAATMGMYDLNEYATDDKLWQLIALCAGTGGSILIIGSASGVALMGLEKVDFLWYAKNVSAGAAVGYFGGIATYLLQNAVTSGALFGNVIPPAMAVVEQVQNANIL